MTQPTTSLGIANFILLTLLALPLRAEPPRCVGSPQAAVEAALVQLDLQPGKDAGWRSRLRWAAVVPRLSVYLNRVNGYGENYGFRVDAPDNLNMNARSLVGWSFRATWDLGQLVYDGREMQLEAARQKRWKERQELAAVVLALYAQREKALAPRPPAADATTAAEQALTVATLEVKLHLLLGEILCPPSTPP